MNIAVIGCGNMATPVVKKIWEDNNAITFHTYTPSQSRAKALAENVQGKFHAKLEDLCNEKIDYWLIACKPQQLENLGSELAGCLSNQKIISILAGTPIAKVQKHLDSKKIIRIMPNTPARYGEGISLMLSSSSMEQADTEQIERLFKACGSVIPLTSEKEFDELTVFSGSGPGYIFHVAKAYYDKLIALGYSSEVSRTLLNDLFYGSALLMRESSDDLQTMVDKVTSKGGVTIEAIKVMQEKQVDQIISESIDQAIRRNNELQQQ